MNSSLLAVLLGLVIGASVVGALTLFFVFSRPYRRIRKFWSLALGYILIPALSVGSILLLRRACDYFHIEARSSAHDYALYAFSISLLIGMIMIILSELRWRKRIGLSDKSVRVARPERIGAGLVICVSYFSFQAGVGTVLLLGPKLFARITFGLAVFSTVCSLMGTVLFGLILTKLLHKQQTE
jgi:hypothetical protein